MGFHEDAVGTNGDGGLGDGLDELGLAAGHSAALVGLLEAVGTVHDDGAAEGLHGGQATEIDDEIGIAEGGAAFGEPDLVVTRVYDLLTGKVHGGRAEELPFFDVDYFAGFGGGDEEVGLPAEEGRDLEYVDVLGGHGGFGNGVDVGGGGQAEALAYLAEDFEGFFIADAGKTVDPAAVGFAVTALENVGNTQLVGNLSHPFCNLHGNVFAFDGAGAGK